MARTFIRQETQIRNSELYDDTKAAGSTLESANVSIEDDLNGTRSQLKRAIFADSAGDWFSDIPTVNGKKRAISALNTDLDDLEEKRILFRVDKIGTDITVPASQNYVVLVQATSQTPAEVAAVGAGSALGAVVAVLAGDVGSHALTEVTGANALSPKNLCLVVDATSGDDILSSGRRVYALVQAETGTVDGEAFNDTTKQAQLSFVRPNATYDDLEAVPSADIQGKSINYSYVRRVALDSIPEAAFLSGNFVDAAAATAVTLDNAIDNQVGPATQNQNIAVRITDTFSWAFYDSTGATQILAIGADAGGDTVDINAEVFSVFATENHFGAGLQIDENGQQINVGVTSGLIESTGANDLRILGAGELLLDDGNQTGSTWAQTTGIKLSDTTAEWSAFETAFGEVSLLNAITSSKRRAKVYANVTANTNADTDVGGVAGGTNLDAQLPNMSVGSFTTDYDVYLNGKLLRPGADASANNDYYPGTSLVNGQLRFEFRARTADVICVVPYAR